MFGRGQSRCKCSQKVRHMCSELVGVMWRCGGQNRTNNTKIQKAVKLSWRGVAWPEECFSGSVTTALPFQHTFPPSQFPSFLLQATTFISSLFLQLNQRFPLPPTLHPSYPHYRKHLIPRGVPLFTQRLLFYVILVFWLDSIVIQVYFDSLMLKCGDS